MPASHSSATMSMTTMDHMPSLAASRMLGMAVAVPSRKTTSSSFAKIYARQCAMSFGTATVTASEVRLRFPIVDSTRNRPACQQGKLAAASVPGVDAADAGHRLVDGFWVAVVVQFAHALGDRVEQLGGVHADMAHAFEVDVHPLGD